MQSCAVLALPAEVHLVQVHPLFTAVVVVVHEVQSVHVVVVVDPAKAAEAICPSYSNPASCKPRPPADPFSFSCASSS